MWLVAKSSRRTEGMAGAWKGADPIVNGIHWSAAYRRRGGMCQGVTANGTRSTGGSGIGATQWSGRVLLSSPSS